MTIRNLEFNDSHIALIVRGKRNPSHHPDKLDQHADCVLGNGSPVGFFGEGGGESAAVGMGMRGKVYYYRDFVRHRPHYIDRAAAKRYNVVSTVLVLRVSTYAVYEFKQAWHTMRVSPGEFDLLGNNCSTHAAIAFYNAGVLADPEVSGIDSPDHLFDDLSAAWGGTSYSGYVGFLPTGRTAGNKYVLEIEAGGNLLY